jgi:hypothetical protein
MINPGAYENQRDHTGGACGADMPGFAEDFKTGITVQREFAEKLRLEGGFNGHKNSRSLARSETVECTMTQLLEVEMETRLLL